MALRNDAAEAHAQAALKDADEAVARAYGDDGSIPLYMAALSARAQVRAQLALAAVLDDVGDWPASSEGV